MLANVVLALGMLVLVPYGFAAGGVAGLATGFVVAMLLSVATQQLTAPAPMSSRLTFAFRLSGVLSLATVLAAMLLGGWRLGWAWAITGSVVAMLVARAIVLLLER